MNKRKSSKVVQVPVTKPASAADIAALEAQIRAGRMTTKQFEEGFITLWKQSGETDCKWLDLALVAPDTFGPCCFDKSKADGLKGREGQNDDYLSLKDTLEHAVYMACYGQPFPDIARLARGQKPTAQEAEKRERVQHVRMTVGVAIGRMATYHARANGYDANEGKPQASLAKWAAGIIKSCKTAKRALPQELALHLKAIASGDAEDYRAFRTHVALEDKRVASHKAGKVAQKVIERAMTDAIAKAGKAKPAKPARKVGFAAKMAA